jgi:hypothetical protein
MTTNFAIIIIGDEILSGKRADKHLPKAIELLGARGLALSYADYVGDDKARITSTLARAFAAARESGDVVFSCGGIGATPDDHTRQCAAAALGVELALHPEAKALITERMKDTAKEQGVPFDENRPDNIHRLNMGMFPVGCDIIPNPYNKIPGFSCYVERKGSSIKQGPRDWLCQTAGAAAPSGGRKLREASDHGGHKTLLQGFFQGSRQGQSHHINALFNQLDRFTLRGLAANDARLSVAVMHGSGVVGELVAHILSVGKNVAYRA